MQRDSATPLWGEHEEDDTSMGENLEMANSWGGAEGGHRFYDNVTGRPLETQSVLDARAEEIQYFKDKKIYVKVPRSKCY